MRRPDRKQPQRGAREEFLQRIAALNVDRSGGVRKPHKPLLLLLAIARLMRHGDCELEFREVEAALRPLLQLYAPPVQGRPQAELPYWHLRSDEVWTVPGSERLQLMSNGRPRLTDLRATRGLIPERFAGPLLADEGFARQAVARLLDEHFEPSLHTDLLAAVGLEPDWLVRRASTAMARAVREARDPLFRDAVLAAYDQRCAVTGFQAMIGGVPFALEAAHVQWHSKGGPSDVTNGIALNPTLHKLFDHGAWSLTDDRRILVSSAFTGSDVALDMLRPLHKKPLRPPVRGAQVVDAEFIRWHREPKLGGVFREPALD
jgi:putative restriction endonuclease